MSHYPPGRLPTKDLLGLKGLDRSSIELLLETAKSFREVLDRPVRKLPTLRGKTVLTLFFEPSTRTSASFDLAAKRLSADSVSFKASGSSMAKGESVLDTLKNLEAMRVDAVVVRAANPGTPHYLARKTRAAVINAGDGPHEHPTQALLDLFTAQQEYGSLTDKKVVIIGDVLHSRVARSNIFGFSAMGAKVTLVGPPTVLPQEFAATGAEISYTPDPHLKDADIVYLLRVQRERLDTPCLPSVQEYRRFWGITRERAMGLKDGAVIMHPGPVNWGVEMDMEVEQEVKTLVLDAVTNGVAVRMAVLFLLLVGAEPQEEL